MQVSIFYNDTSAPLRTLREPKNLELHLAMSTKQIITSIRKELKDLSDPLIKEASKRFFKEQVESYGVKIPVARQVGKKHLALFKKEPKAVVFALCEELWKSGMMEESIIACMFSYSVRKQFEAADFEVFEKWISKYVTNWAACDTFCNHTMGTFLVSYPSYVTELYRWAKNSNRWFRRAAAVSLIVPAGKGLFLKESLEVSKFLLTDPDDLVQKGYGWLLKSASENDTKLVFDFVMNNKASMPRTALRYAIEKLDPSLKKQAMS
jgi:3-methyladenine DNA glycosylase AlkD